MMEWMRQWLLGVTCAAMLVGILRALLPKGGVGAAGRLAGGLLLMIATVQPLLALDPDALAQRLTQLRLEQAAQTQQLEEFGGDLLEELIEEQTQAYILDKAEELGMDCQVEVTCRRQEEGVPVPDRVRVSGTFTGAQRDRLSQIIETDLAIPEEAQSYEEVAA